MDIKQEDMQYVGFLGCYKQSFKIISSCRNRKIFSQITLTLILPLSFIFLFEIQASNLLSKKMKHTEFIRIIILQAPRSKLFDIIIPPEFITLLFKFAYYTFLLIFSLLSTSAIVFTTASIYTGKLDLSFKKVMSAIPKVWKRLMFIFLYDFAFLFWGYIVSAFVGTMAYVLIAIYEKQTDMKVCFVVVSVLVMIFFFLGLVYFTLIWQLANAVTVLEYSYGFEAVDKISEDLLNGKMGLSFFIFFTLNVCIVWIRWLFEVVVMDGSWTFGYIDRTAYGILILFLLSCILLFGLVFQTVIHCFRYENIGKLP